MPFLANRLAFVAGGSITRLKRNDPAGNLSRPDPLELMHRPQVVAADKLACGHARFKETLQCRFVRGVVGKVVPVA
jgi:hypothetical protein